LASPIQQQGLSKTETMAVIKHILNICYNTNMTSEYYPSITHMPQCFIV